ncbi:hypothetical protein MMC25_002764 [Agyrium rufum]|nr:hypothetical protein [Agyrium rufum]
MNRGKKRLDGLDDFNGHVLSPAYPQRSPTRRRPLIRIGIGAFVFLLIFFFASRSAASVTEVAAKHIPHPSINQAKLPSLPSIRNPFRSAVHAPPIQKNSTSGDAKWFDDWKWMNPFSSSITLDENRSVLPPLRTRPPIYTYYDADSDTNAAQRAAEGELLMIWRRAWWAYGFKPVILGRAEATNNPLYEMLQRANVDKSLEVEMMRWLAWGHMGNGILANWLVLPMGPQNDDLISYLRRGQYPKLTRYKHLGSGLFSGEVTKIKETLTKALQGERLTESKTFLEAIPDADVFTVDPSPSSIAFYEASTILARYPSIGETLMKKGPEGLQALGSLINAHLHNTFQNTYSSGLAILSPYSSSATIVSAPAVHLANALVRCPTSPIPSSCPPNRPKCVPCDSSKPIPISFPQSHRNTSRIYTLGTIPHPYTLSALLGSREALDIRYIRRETVRDRWLLAVTNHTLGGNMSGPSRIVSFKEEVASEFGSANGLWRTAETDWEQRDLEWHFGFTLPTIARTTTTTTKIQDKEPSAIPQPPPNPIPEDPSSREASQLLGPLLQSLHLPATVPQPNLLTQSTIFSASRQALQRHEKSPSSSSNNPFSSASLATLSKNTPSEKRIALAVEAWNLADTEAWRFVRAYEARRKVERRKWVEEEAKFVVWKEEEGGDGVVFGEGLVDGGGNASKRGRGWGRWFE